MNGTTPYQRYLNALPSGMEALTQSQFQNQGQTAAALTTAETQNMVDQTNLAETVAANSAAIAAGMVGAPVTTTPAITTAATVPTTVLGFSLTTWAVFAVVSVALFLWHRHSAKK